MDPKQLAWIETSLRDAREDWKICYFHHPLYSNADRHGSSVDLRVLLEPIFIKHGVNVVFSGPRSRLRAAQAAEGHLLFRLGRGRTAAQGQHEADGARPPRTSTRTRASCSSRSPDRICTSRSISRTGKTVDSGVIQRQAKRGETETVTERPGDTQRCICARRASSSRFARRAPASAAARRADRAGVGQHGPGELFPVHLRDRRSP